MEDSTARLPQAQRETKIEPGIETNNYFQELPEDIICEILCFTSPRYVCRFSAISKLWASAADSNNVWSKFLPPQCLDHILSNAVSPLAFSSKKELYFRLCDSIMIDRGRKMVWLERSTAKVSYMLSARELSIVWGDDQRYWRWVSRDDSRFSEVAKLRNVCWLEVRGRIDCRLLSANTEYKVVFVLKFGRDVSGWSETPIKFSLTTPDGQAIERSRLLASNPRSRKFRYENADYYDDHEWLHLVVGNFKVRGDGGYDNSSLHVEFCMEEVDFGHWKYGLLIDGVRIEPTGPNLIRSRTHRPGFNLILSSGIRATNRRANRRRLNSLRTNQSQN